ncbi:MAG: DUF1684 domain-containing protein [Candidatus Nanopelagicaceae bacterium]|nr:DUF1684 domain-containing protein [Candidatus Nanopelagicaceae bacterium]
MTSRTDWDTWRAARLASVVSPTGNLALIETRWQEDGEEVSLEEALVGLPDSVKATNTVQRNFDGEVIARGVRLWDSQSEAIRSFETTDVYPFDPEWVIEATYSQHPESIPVAFEHIKDNGGTRDLVVPGEITLTLDGVEFVLSAFDDGDKLLLVFGDTTNGTETYSAGRFLFVFPTLGTDRITLNFNHAFVPPCGFSSHYNCPLPPPQNRLHIPVRAGERYPIFRDGYKVS